jgi:hypothetical protein
MSAQSAGEQASTATSGVLDQATADKRIVAVKKAVQAGTDAVNAGNQLVNG